MHGREDNAVASHGGPVSHTSRWQKVVGIIGLFVVLWVGSQMAGQLTGRGGPGGPGGMDHGPGQEAPPAEVEEPETDVQDGDGHRPPRGRP